MNELVGTLVSQLGITQEQAGGGMGALLKMAQDKLGTNFSEITKVLPDAQHLISQAPAAEATANTGLGGLVGSVLSAFGQGDSQLAHLAQLAGQFKSLNLDASMIAKFAPVVTEFMKTKGGDTAVNLIEQLMAGKHS